MRYLILGLLVLSGCTSSSGSEIREGGTPAPTPSPAPTQSVKDKDDEAVCYVNRTKNTGVCCPYGHLFSYTTTGIVCVDPVGGKQAAEFREF